MLDTLENVKARLGITVNTYDTFLTQQITMISDVIEAYCRRKFLKAAYVQTFYKEDITSRNTLELFHFPAHDGVVMDFDNVEVDDTSYRLHKPTARLIAPYSLFGQSQITTVEYEAGYDTCPTPILAVLDALVSERYNKKVAGVDLNFGSDVQRISIPGAISIDFDYSLANNERKSAYGTIIGNYTNVLDDWRSERAVVGSGKLSYVEPGTP